MAKVDLKGYKVSKIEFVNKLDNNTQIKLGNKYSYNVSYSNQNLCKGEFEVVVTDNEKSDVFSITAVVEGIFTYEQGTPKEEIHVSTFKEIFPYVRSLVTTITANAGIKPIIIPAINIEEQSIYRFENNAPKQ